jgi:hypothetical protein
MRSLVVYESMYGNTEEIAASVAQGLSRHGAVTVSNVDALAPGALADVDLLVVGAPTQAWGLPRVRTWFGPTTTRTPAAPMPDRFVRDWLQDLPDGHGRAGAAFATRLGRPRALTGSAASGIARRMRRRNWPQLVAPESFIVTGTDGPLREGELDRAEAWGDALGRAVDRRPSAA